MSTIESIKKGEVYLGIEFGSTRIKEVLIGRDGRTIASGSYEWENRLENSLWTYHLEDVWTGIQTAYQDLAEKVRTEYGLNIEKISAIGISAMMHGYLVFDKDDHQLAEFRTWRNTNTKQAAEMLSELFQFNIPQRWSIAHLQQAILNKEDHVKHISYMTTLAGYVHYKLSGRKVIGIGDASGMFPIGEDCQYDRTMMAKFDSLVSTQKVGLKLEDILPQILNAGQDAGTLSETGAALLDVTGVLKCGSLMAPPEGDAGTGMVATDSVAVHTGNVSAGTSVFAMVVLDKALQNYYPQIDMVTTPTGKPVAMVHCNNCTSDINAWAKMLSEFSEAAGAHISYYDAIESIFKSASKGDADCGGLLNYSFLSGEPIVSLEEGRPLLMRLPDASFSFENFARAQVYSAVAALKMGMDILIQKEKVQIDTLLGHGGFFREKGVGQGILASALNTEIGVNETASEGGPWGMALLAEYRALNDGGQTLEEFLDTSVFSTMEQVTIQPDPETTAGFEKYMNRFVSSLSAENEAVANFRKDEGE